MIRSLIILLFLLISTLGIFGIDRDILNTQLHSLKQADQFAFFVEASKRYQVPLHIILGIASRESGLHHPKPTIFQGMMQVRTKRKLSPKEGVYVGTEHLSNLLNRYHGDLIKALSIYNTGRDTKRGRVYAKDIILRAKVFNQLLNERDDT